MSLRATNISFCNDRFAYSILVLSPSSCANKRLSQKFLLVNFDNIKTYLFNPRLLVPTEYCNTSIRSIKVCHINLCQRPLMTLKHSFSIHLFAPLEYGNIRIRFTNVCHKIYVGHTWWHQNLFFTPVFRTTRLRQH